MCTTVWVCLEFHLAIWEEKNQHGLHNLEKVADIASSGREGPPLYGCYVIPGYTVSSHSTILSYWEMGIQAFYNRTTTVDSLVKAITSYMNQRKERLGEWEEKKLPTFLVMSHSVVRIVSPTIYAPLSLFSLWSLWLLLSFPHFIFTGIDSNLITSTHVHTQSLVETLFQDSITALKWIFFFSNFFFHRWRSFLPKRTQLRRQKRKKKLYI